MHPVSYFSIGWILSVYFLVNFSKSFKKSLQTVLDSAVLKHLHISKLNYVTFCFFIISFMNILNSLYPNTDFERHCEKWLFIPCLFSCLLIPQENLHTYTFTDPFHQENPVRDQKLKHKKGSIFPQWSETYFKILNFLNWQAKTPLQKWNIFRNFKLICVYLVSVLLISAILKILRKWDLNRDLPSTQATGSFQKLGKKGIIQQTKQHKLRHFQAAVCWSLLVLKRLLNDCRSILKCTSLISSLECFKLHVWW